jgi:hypothetical protein
MKPIILIIVFTAAIGCKRKLTASEKEASLIKSMREYLYNGINNDSSKVKFDVQTANYFEDKNFFECEFKVRVISPGRDTTGTMTARISKDFSKVFRKL